MPTAASEAGAAATNEDAAPADDNGHLPVVHDPEQSLATRLAAVAGAVDRIPKRGKNTRQNYEFVRESDVTDVIRRELAARHVRLRPDIEWDGVQRTAITSKEGTEGTAWYVPMVMTFVNGDDPTEVDSTHWLGESQDFGDKGLAKALTSAKKTFLIHTFLLSTGDDPEADPAGDRERAPRGQQAAPPPDPEQDTFRALRAMFARARELDVPADPTLRTIMRIGTVSEEYPDGKPSFRLLDAAEARQVLSWMNEYAANRDRGDTYISAWLAKHPVAAEDNERRAAPPPAPATPDPLADAFEPPTAPDRDDE